MEILVYLIVGLPLLGFLVNGVFGARLRSERLSGIIGSAAIAGSFVCSLLVFFQIYDAPTHQYSQSVVLWDWIAGGSLHTSLAYQIDSLSVLMALIITGVGLLIHIYSIGYMHGDRAVWRFFAYLNLFIFAMLQLVLADNFLLTFLGWEGVGLCSYLLIGFWYDKPFDGVGIKWTGDAGMKAFIVNRIGDVGFLLAMFAIYTQFGTLNYSAVFTQASGHVAGEFGLTFITLALFLACTGKSAQLPLYTWLPDAMAGPTPVSALIHAATMVTSGLFIIARCSLLFALSPTTLSIIAIVGALTALFAATIGLFQNDIKKILAYSTVSQLGYMFLAMGCGAFAAGMFHVTTHAFFKALLFLGSGAVIHGMHEEQDVRKMGGLKKYMPVTYITFLVATLAISGIPPFSGFFSKDEILWQAYNNSPVLWGIGILAALCTAFYMWRALTLTFYGKPRFDEKTLHPHEAPKTMTVPLIVLAVLAAVAGFIGMPHLFGVENVFDNWLEPIFSKASDMLFIGATGAVSTEILFMIISVVIAAFGIWLAMRLYSGGMERATALRKRFNGLHTLLYNKYYIDELYNIAIVTPLEFISRRLFWKGLDSGIIDGAVNGLAALFLRFSTMVRRVQVGIVQVYAFGIVMGIIIIVGWFAFFS